jgi:hypothetical protein
MTDFKREVECVYKNERYTVRDNGAVLRHARKGQRLRNYDNHWTFGKPNNNGYMLINTEVIHRIVATAFHGEPPTPQHIVDHIDTNRQNNRPENLRWLTKLENILNNPITVKKITFHCGSIEAFLKDPSILTKHVNQDPNFAWMRTVTSEEARIAWERLSKWAEKENGNTSSKGSSPGAWIYKDKRSLTSFKEQPEIVASQTANAVQKNWKTPNEFPNCPQNSTDNPIESYAANLNTGQVFSRNKYADIIILDYATSDDRKTLWLMCKTNEINAIKPWLLAKVNFEDNLFVHTNLGSFFEKVGAEKQFTIAQGLEWTGENSIDDFT